MPAEIRRQQLLGKKKVSKRPVQKPNQARAAQAKAAQAAAQAQAGANTKAGASAAQSKKSGGIVKKILMYFLLLVLIGLIVAPKPQLLVYKKLGLTATSIYIPGWFGQPGRLLDSPQKVILDKQLGLVYLCFGEIDPAKQLKEQCNRFEFIDEQGMIAAFNYYRAHPTP